MAMRKGLPAKLAATDADDTRYDLSGLVICDVNGVPRSGVLSPVGADVVAPTGTMNVSVKRFQGVAVRDAGVVLLANDGPTNVLLEAAPAANSRIDVIWARQNDASSTVTSPDANNLPVLGVTKGTAAPEPEKPAVPAGSLELASVQVPSTATSTSSSGVVIVQSGQLTAAAGGQVPFRSKSEMDGTLTLPKGTRGVVLADLVEYIFDGAAWVRALHPDSGWVTPTLLAGWANASGAFVGLRYRKVGDYLEFQGAVTGAVSGDPLFTLPVGFRPDVPTGKELVFAVNNGSALAAVTRLVFRSTGVVVAVPGTTPVFDVVRFRAV